MDDKRLDMDGNNHISWCPRSWNSWILELKNSNLVVVQREEKVDFTIRLPVRFTTLLLFIKIDFPHREFFSDEI